MLLSEQRKELMLLHLHIYTLDQTLPAAFRAQHTIGNIFLLLAHAIRKETRDLLSICSLPTADNYLLNLLLNSLSCRTIMGWCN